MKGKNHLAIQNDDDELNGGIFKLWCDKAEEKNVQECTKLLTSLLTLTDALVSMQLVSGGSHVQKPQAVFFLFVHYII